MAHSVNHYVAEKTPLERKALMDLKLEFLTSASLGAWYPNEDTADTTPSWKMLSTAKVWQEVRLPVTFDGVDPNNVRLTLKEPIEGATVTTTGHCISIRVTDKDAEERKLLVKLLTH